MNNALTTQERIALKQHHKLCRDKFICDRIKAVLLYDQGYSYRQIASILLLDDETIRRHVKDYFTTKKLSPDNGGKHPLFIGRRNPGIMQALTGNNLSVCEGYLRLCQAKVWCCL